MATKTCGPVHLNPHGDIHRVTQAKFASLKLHSAMKNTVVRMQMVSGSRSDGCVCNEIIVCATTKIDNPKLLFHGAVQSEPGNSTIHAFSLFGWLVFSHTVSGTHDAVHAC